MTANTPLEESERLLLHRAKLNKALANLAFGGISAAIIAVVGIGVLVRGGLELWGLAITGFGAWSFFNQSEGIKVIAQMRDEAESASTRALDEHLKHTRR